MTGTIIGVVAIVAVFGGLLFVMPKLVQPTVPFGVRVPDTHVAAPAVLQATRRYQRDLIGTMISVVAVLAALAVFVPASGAITAASILPLVAWSTPYTLQKGC